MLAFHIVAGSFVLLSGGFALSFRKGSSLHRISGNLFFVSMLLLCTSAIFLADDPSVAIFSLYFITTAWAIVIRPEKETGYFEWAAFLFVSALSLRFFVDAVSATNDFEIVVNYIFGSVAALAAFLDLNMIIRGGLSGAHRIARHLWRMCYALLGAVASFTDNTADKWPEFINVNILLYAVLATMIFWLARVLLTKWIVQAEKHYVKDLKVNMRKLLKLDS